MVGGLGGGWKLEENYLQSLENVTLINDFLPSPLVTSLVVNAKHVMKMVAEKRGLQERSSRTYDGY